MMDGSLKLIILCGVMLFGSYLAGSIPLFISLSEEKLQVSCIIFFPYSSLKLSLSL